MEKQMKKTLLAATAAILALASVEGAIANCGFNGWSAGVNAGWMSTKANFKSNGTSVNKANYSTAPIGVHLDWTQSAANAWLYGFGLEAGYAAGKPSNNFRSGGVNYKATFDPRFYGAVSARLGWNFNNQWALYGLVAGRALNTKLSITSAGSSASSSKTVLGLGAGVGADVKVAERWTLGVQYRHFWDSSVKFSNTDKVDLRSHNVIAKLSYSF
jgi:opacity protein-like surface antigen